MVTSHVLDHRSVYGDPDLKMFTNCDFQKSDKEKVNFVLKHLCNKGFVNVTETKKLHKDNGWDIGFYEMESEDKWYYIKPNHHGFTIPGDHWKPSDRSGRKNFNLQQLNDALENVCQVIENKNQYY